MLLTPPPTNKKQGMFAKDKLRLDYYENRYGSRNNDEADEGVVEHCETESDIDDEVKSSNTRTPTPGDADKSGHQYRITPRFHSKRSLAAADLNKLQSNRFGMFSRAGRDKDEDILEDIVPTIAIDDDEAEETQFKDESFAAVQGAANEPAARRGRVRRPANRRLINQELREKAAADKKAAQAAARATARLAKKVQLRKLANKGARAKGVTGAKAKSGFKKLPASSAEGIGSKSTKKGAQQLKVGYVMVDNGSVNFEEYQRM